MKRGLWKSIAAYGAALALGALALQWLEYDRLARSRPGDIYLALVAVAFLALGVFLGARLLVRPKAVPFDGNPQAVASLGISPRELIVLKELAAGHSNKQIAEEIFVSEKTVKNHLNHLFKKLGVKNRTEAVVKAIERGLVSMQ